MLKIGTFGMALTSVWIPCLKSYPLLVTCLMILHAIFVAIGPLNTMMTFLRRGYRTYSCQLLVQYMNFFNIVGKGVIFHYCKNPLKENNDTGLFWLFRYLNDLFIAQTPLEFVHLESGLAVSLFSWLFASELPVFQIFQM